MACKPPTSKLPKPPALNRAQQKAGTVAVKDACDKLALARGAAAAIFKKARQKVMDTMDRAVTRDPATAKSTKLAKRGYRRD